MIIDFHSHLGDILNENGGRLIYEIGKEDRNLFDRPIKLRDLGDTGYWAGILNYNHGGKEIPSFMKKWNVLSTTKRNACASYGNFARSMKSSGTDYACCLPTPPYLFFEDLKKVDDKRIIAFTGVDFTRNYDVEEELKEHVKLGAKGMKLHPILQKVSLREERVKDVVEIWRDVGMGLPILFHCGVTSYYFGDDYFNKQEVDYGNVDDAKVLIESFKDVTFVVGHAGITAVDEVIEKLSGFENTYVDTSFQPIEKIRELVNKFGEDRVMYASDWPYGSRSKSIKIGEKAFKGNDRLERKFFSENARGLMKI